MNLKRYEQKVGYAQLDNLIETLGEKGLMSVIVERLSQGIKPSLIASNLQVPFMVLWEWLEADPARQRAYDQGWQMFASDMHAETVSIADAATIEEVPLAKLRIDTRFKAASNYDKKRFSAQQQQTAHGFSGGVTIVIGSVAVPELTVTQVPPQVESRQSVTLDAQRVPDSQESYQIELADHNKLLEVEEAEEL